MFNIGDMFGKLQKLQTEMAEAKNQLKSILVTAESGAGMVKVTASCDVRIRSIQIDPEIIDKNDPELLQDLVTAAVNLALHQAEEKSKDEMAKIAKDKLPNIPGMDLSKFGMP
jgi:DNA-binding YbaB/EbfC family protein